MAPADRAGYLNLTEMVQKTCQVTGEGYFFYLLLYDVGDWVLWFVSLEGSASFCSMTLTVELKDCGYPGLRTREEIRAAIIPHVLTHILTHILTVP